MCKNLKDLSDISEDERLILFKTYIRFLNPPKIYIKDLKKDFNIIMMYRPMMMPYIIVKKLIEMGFDIDQKYLDDKF